MEAWHRRSRLCPNRKITGGGACATLHSCGRSLRATGWFLATISVAIFWCRPGLADDTNNPAASASATVAGANTAPASETVPPSWVPKPPAVASSDLSRSINEVVKRREFAWRFPRERLAADPNAEQGFISRFLDEVGRTIQNWLKPIKRWWKRFEEWLRDFLRRWQRESRPNEPGSIDWQLTVQVLGVFLLAVVACVLAIFLWRTWKKRGRSVQVARAVAMPLPDLRDEEVQADQMAPDEWYVRANEMLRKGELRLALRAFYLSTLAFLAQREWLVIARYKTNREYEKELQRRAAARGEMVEAFGHNVGLFERAWYGTHEVTPEHVERFVSNHQKIRTCSEK